MKLISSNIKRLDKDSGTDIPISNQSYESCSRFRNSKGTDARQIVDKNKLLYDHTEFNEAIEILIKMLDRLDRFDGIFAQ
ncbi:MAG: hypothetical protein WA941_08835 [Nitrososphaeraceae archaeon]